MRAAIVLGSTRIIDATLEVQDTTMPRKLDLATGIELYEQAIASARQYSFSQYEALGNALTSSAFVFPTINSILRTGVVWNILAHSSTIPTRENCTNISLRCYLSLRPMGGFPEIPATAGYVHSNFTG
jgi:hypothetical protein